jgi:DnaD/phage-associated family protein
MFTLNPAAYGSMFAVPGAIVDKYIILASELQLKVLLVIAKNAVASPDAESIAAFLRKNANDVADALEYWQNEGIIIKNGEAPKPIAEANAESSAASKTEDVRTEVKEIPVIKPTMEQVIARQEECPELKYLFNQAQEMLGRTIGWDGQSRLLIIYDQYGLPIDVILMLLGYLKSTGRTSSTEITRLAKKWADEDIRTHELANDYIDRMNNASAVYDEIKARFGLGHEAPSTKQAQFISEWLEMGFSTEMILKAYDEMVDKTGKPSFAYVNKILLSWHEKGYKSTSDVEKGESKNKPVKGKEKKATYNIEKVKERNRSKRLKYEKKAKN